MHPRLKMTPTRLGKMSALVDLPSNSHQIDLVEERSGYRVTVGESGIRGRELLLLPPSPFSLKNGYNHLRREFRC